MNSDSGLNKLITEEIKATKLYLWLFYIIFLAYDLLYYYIIPLANDGKVKGLSKAGLSYWVHIIVLALLPITIFILKKSKPYIVKYFIFIGYNLIDFINSLIIYLDIDSQFASGNIVELLFILYTPIFLNKKYFWFISLTMIMKYALLGIILQDPTVLNGISILSIVAGISYIFLYRFYSYINTLEKINDDLRNKEKMAVVGQLATSIGHEIRNPLAALKGFTQLQKEKFGNENEFFQIMENEIERINLIVNDLMYIGKPKSLILAKHDIKEIIQYVKLILSQIAQSNKVNIVLDLENLPKVNCDENQLKQVFINLLKNAIESMPAGGNINISSKLDNKYLVILIKDEGQGIEEEKLTMLGQPFFTTKQDGHGLGLLVTFNIIEKHNGKIIYNSVIGKGTVVEICLPVY